MLSGFRSSPLPDWLVGLVTDVEAPPLELDDVAFLEVLQTGVSEHLLLQLRTKADENEHTKLEPHSELHTEQRADLAVFIDVLLEVVVFGDDSFGDQWLKADADGWQQGGAVCFSQPRDLCCLLVVFIVQIQTCLYGQNPPISPSVTREEDKMNR